MQNKEQISEYVVMLVINLVAAGIVSYDMFAYMSAVPNYVMLLLIPLLTSGNLIRWIIILKRKE